MIQTPACSPTLQGSSVPKATLSALGLRLQTDRGELNVGDLFTGPGNAVCAGAARALVRAFIEPRSVLSGQLLCDGQPPAQALTNLHCGYAPRRLIADAKLRVREVLLLSGRTVGLGKSDVNRALVEAHADGFAASKLGELSTFQQRLVGLAHGVCGRPLRLVVEDPYVDVDQPGAAALEAIYDRVLHRPFIATVEADSPYSRSLLARADQVFIAVAGQLLEPCSPSDLPRQGLWVSWVGPDGTAEDTSWVSSLQEDASHVTRTPRPGLLLVRGMSGLRVLELASQMGVRVRELSPASCY